MRPSMRSLFVVVAVAGWFVVVTTAHAIPVFIDDFTDGIDPTKWYLETIQGTTWIGHDGIASSTIPDQIDYHNRFLDMHTQESGWTDFTVRWDMRGDTSDYAADHRQFYFRSEGDEATPRDIPDAYLVRADYAYCGNRLLIATQKDYGMTVLAERTFPWELYTWYTFELQVIGNDFKLRVWDRDDAQPDEWTLEAIDPDWTFTNGRFGCGNYLRAQTHVDNVALTAIPEPALLLPLGVGMLGIVQMVARRRIDRTSGPGRSS